MKWAWGVSYTKVAIKNHVYALFHIFGLFEATLINQGTDFVNNIKEQAQREFIRK